MPRLSVFLIVKNESRDLPACLESIKSIASEIVVVDSGSTDATQEIARRAGARMFSRAFDGFAAQKQFALDQTTGDWVLSIDADERVSGALGTEIKSLLASPNLRAGYEISRRLFFLGHRLRHGGVGTDWVLRLFQKGKGHFRSVRVHESVQVDGTVGRLQHSLDHYSYHSLEEYAEKANHYTTLAAQDLYGRGRRFSWIHYLRPGWELFRRVVIKGAWLDGQPGLVYAAMSSHTAWLRAIKLWELQNAAAARSQAP